MLKLLSLRKAIISLESILEKIHDEKFMSGLDDIIRYGLKAGAVKNFEFTYELCWKYMKRWLEVNMGNDYVDGITRKELFRLSAENKLINDPSRWFRYLEARNLTSHTYNEAVADNVIDILTEFMKDAKDLFKALEARND